MERVWLSRMRWRLRGAVQWPVFAVLVVVDTIVLHELPFAGEGPDWVQALLLAGFFSLVTVAVLAPLAGRVVARRRTDLPRVVADDYAGAGLLATVTLVLVVAGLAHRDDRAAARDAFAAQSDAVRRYVARREVAPEFRRNVARATAVAFGDGLFRTCVPSDRPRRSLCLFVDTTDAPPGVRLDPNRADNSTYMPRDSE